MVAFLSKSTLFQISLYKKGLKMPSRLIVVKVGTNGITREGKLDETEMENLSSQIAAATKQGDKIVLVTSGAVAAGIAELEIPPKPKDVAFQQAAAATGQIVLMAKYREIFKKFDLKVAQILAYCRGPFQQGVLRSHMRRVGVALENWCSSNNKRK